MLHAHSNLLALQQAKNSGPFEAEQSIEEFLWDQDVVLVKALSLCKTIVTPPSHLPYKTPFLRFGRAIKVEYFSMAYNGKAHA